MIGQTLGHYCIVEKIGQGGMGVVYRAWDELLERDVALKVLPAGALADEAARNRFRNEALTLAKLNHPNIETVYEFGSDQGVDFLAMELVLGKTLNAVLAEGALSNRETQRLGVLLAEGLAAAHTQGVIHRDLKPGNLMLTSDRRLKILDFGLARLFEADGGVDASRTLTATSSVSGTLPYMSPEQLKGLPADARSDIFAAGAVLYEMATGRRPFPQSQSAELIGAILHQNPAPADSVNHRLTSELVAIIHKCLEKRPESRYQSARELLAALEGTASGSLSAVSAKRRGPLVLTGVSALALALFLGIVLGLNVGGLRESAEKRLFRHNAPDPTSAASKVLGRPVKARRSLAVLGFKNLSGRADAAWLSTAFSEMLTTDLASGESVRTIPGEAVSRMKMDLALVDTAGLAPDTLNRIHQNLGADLIVLGGYTVLGSKPEGQIRLDLRLQDAKSGETLASVAEQGKETDLFDIVTRAGATLRPRLGMGPVSDSDAPGLRAVAPSSTDAARLYAEGLNKLRLSETPEAKTLLETASAADPRNALIHSALAHAWADLGYDGKAAEEARRAWELSANLPQEQRLMVEAYYRMLHHESVKSGAIFQTLWQRYPDNLDYGLRLAEFYTTTGKGQDALATVGAMRQLPSPLGQDPEIDMEEARAKLALSDFTGAIEAAGHAAEKAKARGSRILYGRARLSQGWNEAQLGDKKKAKADLEDAERVFKETGYLMGEAYVKVDLGVVYRHEGDLDDAMRLFEETLAIRRQIGNRADEITALIDIAGVLKDRGKLGEARRRYDECLTIAREIGDERGLVLALGNGGGALFARGDLAQARKRFEEAETLYRKRGSKYGLSATLANVGETLLAQGNLAEAEKKYEEARGIAQSIGKKDVLAFAIAGFGQVLLARGDLTEATKKQQEALSIREQIGEKGSVAESRVALAELALEQENWPGAESLARQAAEEFAVEKRADDEALAETWPARPGRTRKNVRGG